MYTMQDYQLQHAIIESVIDYLPTAIIVLDTDTHIVLANKGAEDLAQKTRAHLFGLGGGDAFDCVHAHDDPRGCGYGFDCKKCILRHTVEQTISSKQGQTNVDIPMTFIEAGKRVLRISTSWLDDNKLVIVALNDVTELKEQETLRLENTKLQAAINTGGAVCHELNQPLSIIYGYIDLLEIGNHSDSSRCCEYLEILRQQVTRISEITNKLMHITRYNEADYGCVTILDINRSASE